MGTVVKDQLASHESARERFGESPDLEAWERLHGTALTLVVAIDQVLAWRSGELQRLGIGPDLTRSHGARWRARA